MIDEQRRKNSSRRGETREDPIVERHEILLTEDQMFRFVMGVVLLNGFTGQS
jgi:hypothetical protein